MASDASGVVTFNVGGQNFTTSKETLLKEANSRLALIARGLLATVRDPATGGHVIDRDPKCFPLILNWLRDGWCSLPRNPDERRELLQEVRYYQLTTLEGWLRTQELLTEPGLHSAQDGLTIESPKTTRLQVPLTQQQLPQASYSGGAPQPLSLSYNLYNSYPPFGSPGAAPPAASSPRAAATATGGTIPVHRGTTAMPWMSSGPSPPGTATATGTSSHLHQTTTLGPESPGRGTFGLAPTGTGGSSSGAAGAPGSAIAALREAFLAATTPQRPAQHVAPYSLPTTVSADDTTSWTSKYLKGNESLRTLVNTLLELAYLAPHRALNGGKVQLSISVACGHGTEASLVASKEEYQRSKLLEVRVKCALGWSFELVLRPSSEVALWDKYGNVASVVQDNWFVLGAILKDQFGILMEEDASARPSCMACRRTCLAISLRKIY